MRQLWCVLDAGEEGGGDAEEGCPELDLGGAVGGEEEEEGYEDFEDAEVDFGLDCWREGEGRGAHVNEDDPGEDYG